MHILDALTRFQTQLEADGRSVHTRRQYDRHVRLAEGVGPEAQRDYMMFALMLSSGIRLGSAIALDVEDVDLEAGEMFLKAAKGNRRERVFLGKTIGAHLRRFIGDRTAGALFVGIHGRRISDRHVQRRYREWVHRAGIARATSTHCLRHTLATRLYQRTGDLLLVQQALRHRSISSTIVYAAVDDRRLRGVLGG